MADYHVDIVTPEKLVFSGPASDVRAPGWEGQFGALAGHDLYMTLLRCGPVILNTPEGEKKFLIGRGFAEVTQERVTLVVDSCREPAKVDKEAARKRLVELESQLADSNAWTELHELIVAKHELATAEIEA